MKTKYKNNDHLPRYYNGDTRYERVKEQMDLLGITDVTTNRQHKNGTVVWQLPIKNNHFPTSYIEVASFKTGYVRNQNSGYSNYQLNKRVDGQPEYFKDYEWVEKDGDLVQEFTGKYTMFQTRGCKLIPIEIDRLEYLISYCLKNYFVKRANEVAKGEYVSKSYYEYMLEEANSPTVTRNLKKISELESDVRGLETKYQASQSWENELQEKLDAMTEARDYHLNKVHSLENKLAETKVRQDVSVIVNGHRYKVL